MELNRLNTLRVYSTFSTALLPAYIRSFVVKLEHVLVVRCRLLRYGRCQCVLSQAVFTARAVGCQWRGSAALQLKP